MAAKHRNPKLEDLSVLSAVNSVLHTYAERRVFSGIAVAKSGGRQRTLNILWHYNRSYRFEVDLDSHSVSFPALLPDVPSRSSMLSELKRFLAPFNTDELPNHRRVRSEFGRLRVTALKGSVNLAMNVKNDEYEYCTRKLVHITHEIFMVFLRDGPYFDYRVQSLGLNPDVEYA